MWKRLKLEMASGGKSRLVHLGIISRLGCKACWPDLCAPQRSEASDTRSVYYTPSLFFCTALAYPAFITLSISTSAPGHSVQSTQKGGPSAEMDCPLKDSIFREAVELAGMRSIVNGLICFRVDYSSVLSAILLSCSRRMRPSCCW